MNKDFLFFNYSWVANSTYIFKSIEKLGYNCDFVDEASLNSFKPEHKYKCVVLYLHENWTIPITNYLINNYFQDSILIQHDDTDFEDVQVWGQRHPDVIMQRELNDSTKNPYSCPIYPFHFPIHSKLDQNLQNKTYDICFMCNITNQRRVPFARHVHDLATGKLKNLSWALDISNGRSPNVSSSQYIEIINKSKIGLNYFGNSYDSWRTWELASVKTAIIMPRLRMKSVSDGFMPFKNYCVIQDDFQDLEEKILYMLKDDNYKGYAEKAFNDYNNNHTPQKCFEYYFNIIKKYIPNL